MGCVARAPAPANCRHELRANLRNEENELDRARTKAYLRVPARGRGRPRHIHKKTKKAKLISQTGVYLVPARPPSHVMHSINLSIRLRQPLLGRLHWQLAGGAPAPHIRLRPRRAKLFQLLLSTLLNPLPPRFRIRGVIRQQDFRLAAECGRLSLTSTTTHQHPPQPGCAESSPAPHGRASISRAYSTSPGWETSK